MNKVVRDFECAMCGRCCASQDLVQLTAYELYRLARHLGADPAEFFRRYCTVTATSLNPKPHLYIRTAGSACPFLEEGRCSVHAARPYACQAYPMRVYWATAGEMKSFVRSRYRLEDTCSLFGLDDDDVLLGDYRLLARQTVAYWVDDAYFGMAGPVVDLSVPYRVADLYVHDPAILEAAKRYAVNPAHPPSAFAAEMAYARIALTIQAALWGATFAFVATEGPETCEDGRIGRYLRLEAGGDAVRALRLLVEGGRMDLARTMAMDSQARPDTRIVAAAVGSSPDAAALGFVFAAGRNQIEELTSNGKRPLQVFFADGGRLVGFPLKLDRADGVNSHAQG